MSWYLAPALVQLRRELAARWPGRDTASDGSIGDAAHTSRTSDHNPDANGRVDAIDVDENPSRGSTREDVGESLWAWMIANRPRQVEYAIYERKILSSYDHAAGPAWRPRPYSGSNPHTSHVHISVLDDHAEDASPWGYGPATSTEEDPMLTNGDAGNGVSRIQQALKAWKPAALPKFGVDGDYGAETETWVRNYQKAAGIEQTGRVDGVTAALLLRHLDDDGGTVPKHSHPVPPHTHPVTVGQPR